MSERVLLAHLVACAACRRVGPLQLVDDLVPPPRLRVELLSAARSHRPDHGWRPRPRRRSPWRHLAR